MTLNCWGGKVLEPLMEFLVRHARTTDVFCFQEVLFGNEPTSNVHSTRTNLFDEIRIILSDFQALIRLAPPGSLFAGLDPQVPTGQAIFVRPGITIEEDGGFNTYDATDPIAEDRSITTTGHVQFVRLSSAIGSLVIANLHGLWQREGKVDNPARFRQAEIIREFLARQLGGKVLCGDFNMLPRMESYRILTEEMDDHVAMNAIGTTRSSLYAHIAKAPHSDYILSSPDLQPTKFEVLPDIVSDHLPLILDFKA